MTRSLGIDVGGSGARWCLQECEGRSRMGVSAGFSGHLQRPEMRAAAEASLASIAAETGPADAVVAGVTGLTAGTAECEIMAELIRKAFSAHRVMALGDGHLAYLSVFQPGEGLLVYAGTGSAASHVAADGTQTLVGGKGVVIDDAGGGHWIAVRALRSILRREDAVPDSAWSTPLGAALARRVGGRDWPLVRQAVYAADRGAVGRLALAVGEAAEAGDAHALDILARAGRALAALAVVLEGRVGARPVALAGRAAALHPVLFDSFASALGARTSTLVTLDAAAGAERLAAALAHEPSASSPFREGQASRLSH